MADIDIHTTIADLVAEKPARSRIFEGLGIDYCCGGKRPLEEVCAERGLDARTLINTLVLAETTAGEPAVDLRRSAPRELIEHIVEVHHGYLRRELPRLSEIGAHVASHHGEREPRLLEVATVFEKLRSQLEKHIAAEESELFSRFLGHEGGGPNSSTGGRALIEELETEHSETGALLEGLAALTDNFTVPEWGCNSFRAYYAGLSDLQSDIHEHVHKENNILFPMIIEG